jgi:hypothetical protein
MKVIKILFGLTLVFAAFKALIQLLPGAINLPSLAGTLIGFVIVGGSGFYLLKSAFKSDSIEDNESKNSDS